VDQDEAIGISIFLLSFGHHLSKYLSNVITVCVDLVDHVLKLGFSRVLSERPHDGSQLLCGDGSIAILVEQGECLLEFGDLLFRQLIGLQEWSSKKKYNQLYKTNHNRIG
jgi:hypothetical protein